VTRAPRDIAFPGLLPGLFPSENGQRVAAGSPMGSSRREQLREPHADHCPMDNAAAAGEEVQPLGSGRVRIATTEWTVVDGVAGDRLAARLASLLVSEVPDGRSRHCD
jgi:hypothetical protein